MIKAVLLDDEIHCTKTLEILIKEHCPQLQIVGIFNHPAEAMVFLRMNKIDVLFLDIEMPFINGFELLNKIPPIDYKVIFTTAYDQFAVKAFKYSAFDYILKPIDEIELVNSVKLLEKNVSGTQQLDMLIEMLNSGNKKTDKVALPTSEGLEFVLIKDIVRCESDSNYTRIILNPRKMIMVSKTLKDMTDLLGDLGFVRVHNSHLINPIHMKKYVKSGGGYLVLSDGVEIPISRQKKESVLEILNAV